MERAIKHYFDTEIEEKAELDFGWKENYLLILKNGPKVIFRAYNDHTERFEREKFYYESVNERIGKICPEVYAVDGTCRYYDKPFQISEYLPGKSLREYLMGEADENKRRNVYYQLGALTAQLNSLEISPYHPYVSGRKSWNEYFADSLLRVQLERIVENGFITSAEVDILCQKAKSEKAAHSLSFLHRDIRPDNIIYNDGKLFVIDAELCEFGDPLNELARIDLELSFWEMFDVLLDGYKSISDISVKSELYGLYQLEWIAELLDMHCNHGAMNSSTRRFLDMFKHIKTDLLNNSEL